MTHNCVLTAEVLYSSILVVKSTDVTFKYDLNNLKSLLHLKLSVICFLKEIIDKELINRNILTILFNYKKKLYI